MNFRIIEGKSDGVDYEELKKDWLNRDMSVKDILNKHNISRKRYSTYRKRLVEDTGIPKKPSNHKGGWIFD